MDASGNYITPEPGSWFDVGSANPLKKPAVKNPASQKSAAKKSEISSEDKAHQERVARIKKARETGIFDNQHIKDLQDEEAYQRGGGTGKTVAQVAVQQAAGAGGGGAKTTSAASPATEKSAAKNPEPEAKPSYSRTEEVAYIAYLSKAAQETQDPEVRAALERMAAEKTKNLEMQNIREQYGSAGVAAFLAAQNPYNAMTNPTGWQGPAPGAGMVAPGAAADVAGRLYLQRMSQAAAEVARLRQIYGQGAGAHEFLRPGSASYNSFGALSPEQQLAAIQAANTYSGAFNQNTKNSAGNMTELYRKAGFKPSEVPQVDPARFAPGYKWQPPTAPVAPVMPTYVTPGFADPQAPVQYPANPMAGTPMPYAMAPINPFSSYQA